MNTTLKLGRVKKERMEEHSPKISKVLHLMLIRLEFLMTNQTLLKIQGLVPSNALNVFES